MKASDEIKRLQAKIDSGEMSPDEPLFTLRAQDVIAPNVVIDWSATAFKAGTPAAKCNEALALARLMIEWPGTKHVPGRPDLSTKASPDLFEGDPRNDYATPETTA